MLLVSSFGVGHSQQDVAFLAGPPLCEAAVHRRLGAFIGEMLSPATQIGRSRLAFGIHLAIIAQGHAAETGYSGMFLCRPRRCGASARACVSLLRVCAGSIFSSTTPISIAESTPPAIRSCSAASSSCSASRS